MTVDTHPIRDALTSWALWIEVAAAHVAAVVGSQVGPWGRTLFKAALQREEQKIMTVDVNAFAGLAKLAGEFKTAVVGEFSKVTGQDLTSTVVEGVEHAAPALIADIGAKVPGPWGKVLGDAELMGRVLKVGEDVVAVGLEIEARLAAPDEAPTEPPPPAEDPPAA